MCLPPQEEHSLPDTVSSLLFSCLQVSGAWHSLPHPAEKTTCPNFQSLCHSSWPACHPDMPPLAGALPASLLSPTPAICLLRLFINTEQNIGLPAETHMAMAAAPPHTPPSTHSCELFAAVEAGRAHTFAPTPANAAGPPARARTSPLVLPNVLLSSRVQEHHMLLPLTWAGQLLLQMLHGTLGILITSRR